MLDLTQFVEQIAGRSAAIFNTRKTEANFDLYQMSALS